MRSRIGKLAVLAAAAAVAVVGFVLLTDGDGDGSSAEGTPARASSGPIRFLLDHEYAPRERVAVKIENVGTQTYRYIDTKYAACYLRYFDSAGREFKIPPGTHCDIIVPAELEPGETATLFTWRLDECVKDRWGCVKRRPLAPDRYVIRGRFRALDGGPPAKPETSFRIVDSSA
jgi:hypothetical protein